MKRLTTTSATSAIALLLTLVISCLSVPKCIAFAQQSERPSFEVNSVKPGDPNNPHGGMGNGETGRFKATNVPLQMLLLYAYEVQKQQVSGAPNWISSERFTIEAKAYSERPNERFDRSTIRLMIQSLLADRFKLVVHRSTRDEKVYELSVKKGGSSMKEAEGPSKDGRMGLWVEKGDEITGVGSAMPPFVSYLSQQLQHIVIDKTNLTGKYNFVLKWKPNPGLFGGPPPIQGDPLPTSDLSDRSIFAALQEDLGLRLQSAVDPVEMLVIDHVQKPDPN
ncbi:MAG TPA: TIGR03435 family protein [Bryobacteraceae bacterium]|jgi:uncharacterized protein (TIGR03435 family)